MTASTETSLATVTVHVTGDDGRAVVLRPGDAIPAEFLSKVGLHARTGEPVAEEATPSEFDGLSVTQLRSRLRAAGENATGTKTELIDRLTAVTTK